VLVFRSKLCLALAPGHAASIGKRKCELNV
jgi:hypothetical protein